MKIVKISLLLVAAVLVVFGLSNTGSAFHSGGVAECVGCHEMHGAASASLLKGGDTSSTCMLSTCHAQQTAGSYHIYTDAISGNPASIPFNYTPGGDFGWLKKNYYWTVRGGLNTEMGQHHGHNVIATDWSLGVDTDNATAPGGTFPSGQLGCISCHDMHGKGRWLSTGTYAKTGQAIWSSGSYGATPTVVGSENLATGVYRLLRGGGDVVDGVTFAGTPPVAVTNSTYNRSEFYTQTRTVYGSGMGDYCGVCHPDMHSTAGILRHPTEQVMSGAIQGIYGSYVKSGDMTGAAATSYLSLVPYEEGLTYTTGNITAMKSRALTTDANLSGPTGAATVMCLSCHRAHATAFVEMLRYENEGEFMTYNGFYPGTDSTPSVPQFARGKSSAETAAGYYNRPVSKFSAYQRVLCNKCHAKD
jgi:hypothetical protein